LHLWRLIGFDLYFVGSRGGISAGICGLDNQGEFRALGTQWHITLQVDDAVLSDLHRRLVQTRSSE